MRDAIASARAQLASMVIVAAALAAVCFAVLVTAGQAAANEARIVEQIDSAGTRLIALSDNGGDSGLLPSAPEVLAGLSDVSWAFGLGAAVDVTNPALPLGRAAAQILVGELPSELRIVQGRPPRPGEAIVGGEAAGGLNLGPGLGRVQTAGGDPVGVVGVFSAVGPLAHLNQVVLIAASPTDIDTLRYVYVMARDVSVVERLERVLTTSTPALKPTALTIETPQGAIALREVIAGRLGAASRQLMAVIMGVGAVVVAVTMFAATVPRRPEFGRRRALGATRSAIVASLLMQTSLGVVVGVTGGVVGGLAVLAFTTGSLPTWRFSAGVAGLASLLALLASLPVAVLAARRDPLRVLRVP